MSPSRFACVAALSCVSLSPLTLSNVLHAGEPAPPVVSEAVDVDWRDSRLLGGNSRIGVAASLGYGARVDFMSDAFTGQDIEVVPGEPIDVEVAPASVKDREHDAFGGEFFYEYAFQEPIVTDGLHQTWGIHLGFGYQKLEFDATGLAETFDVAAPDVSVGFGQLEHDLEADMYIFNAGLFAESYLSERVYMTVGAGLTGAYITSDYSIAGPYNFASESTDESDFTYGGYLMATLGYDLTESFSVFAGLRYQYLSSFDVRTGFSEAEIQFEHTYTAFLGVRWRF